MNNDSRIYIAGHRGLVGGAVMRRLRALGYRNLITRTHAELDLADQGAVESFFSAERPEYVFLCAARVGGINANRSMPVDFIYDNMMISFNVIMAAYRHGAAKLLNLGSSCIYPRMAPQPLKEEYLLTGPLEPTNEPYALAKISAIKLCSALNRQHGTNFISAMPTNLYGPGDKYDLDTSHVLPAMIRKFHEAKASGSDKVVLWGDGTPCREFLFSDDLAEAVVFLMENTNAVEIGDFVNVGTGQDIEIRELAEIVGEITYRDIPGRHCSIAWDSAMPNGTPKKMLDIARMTSLGWMAHTDLRVGIEMAYKDYLDCIGIYSK